MVVLLAPSICNHLVYNLPHYPDRLNTTRVHAIAFGAIFNTSKRIRTTFSNSERVNRNDINIGLSQSRTSDALCSCHSRGVFALILNRNCADFLVDFQKWRGTHNRRKGRENFLMCDELSKQSILVPQNGHSKVINGRIVCVWLSSTAFMFCNKASLGAGCWANVRATWRSQLAASLPRFWPSIADGMQWLRGPLAARGRYLIAACVTPFFANCSEDLVVAFVLHNNIGRDYGTGNLSFCGVDDKESAQRAFSGSLMTGQNIFSSEMSSRRTSLVCTVEMIVG